MYFTHQTKFNDDIKFQYYKKKIKNLSDKMVGFCNYKSFATKWVK